MIRAAIRTYLKTKPALTSLLGGATTPRIYWQRVPPSDTPLANYPCLVFRRATGGYEHDMDGGAGKAQPEFEFFSMGAHGRDEEVVEQIAEQSRLAMQGFSGVWGDVTIDEVLIDDEFDDFIETKVGDDEYSFDVIGQVYRIGHQVAKPA